MGDQGLIPGFGRFLGGGHGNQLQYFCLENPYGQRILMGQSPRGHKESDTTERLSTAQGGLNIHTKYSKTKATRYILFSSVHGIFSRTDHMLGHKNLKKFKKTEVISSIFPTITGLKYKLIRRRKTRKFTNMWRLNNSATEQPKCQ